MHWIAFELHLRITTESLMWRTKLLLIFGATPSMAEVYGFVWVSVAECVSDINI